MNETYMLRGRRSPMWHLPPMLEHQSGKTLCSTPILGSEERLLPPDQPKPGDVLCPKCQQIKRALDKKHALAEAAETETKTD